jgi:hypothetical protein
METTTSQPVANPVTPAEVPQTQNPVNTQGTLPSETDTSLDQPQGEPDAVQTQSPSDEAQKPNPFDQFKTDKSESQPPAESEQGQDPVDDPAPPEDWKKSLPEKYRNNPYINRFDSMEKFIESAENAQRLLGKKGLERPAPDAPPEHWSEYWDAIGRPKSPSDYQIENITDSTGAVEFEFSKESLDGILPEMHKRGFTNDQAQFVMDQYAALEMANSQTAEAKYLAQTEQTLTNLQSEYKESTEAKIRRGLLALENLGLYEVLEQHKLDTSEAFIRAGIKLSEQFSEAVVGTGASVKDHITRLSEIENSPAFKNARDPKHKQAVAERLRILKEMS